MKEQTAESNHQRKQDQNKFSGSDVCCLSDTGGILYFEDWSGVDWICKRRTCKTRICKTQTCKMYHNSLQKHVCSSCPIKTGYCKKM